MEKRGNKVSTKEQLENLVELIARNPEIGLGKQAFGLSKNYLRQKWEGFAKKLNSLGPPFRNAKEWQRVWIHFKAKTKQKVANNRRNVLPTEGGLSEEVHLSPLEEVVAELMHMKRQVIPEEIGGKFEFKNMDLEYTSSSKWIICRICLKNSKDMIKIFDNPTEMDLVKKIEECGGVTLSTASNLPDSICNKCLTLLRAAAKFREKMQRSQAELVGIFLTKPSYDHRCMEIEEECKKFFKVEKNGSEIVVQNMNAKPEFILPEENNSVDSNIEQLDYTVEFQGVESEIISVDDSMIGDPSFELLKDNDKLIDYVEQDVNEVINSVDHNDMELIFKNPSPTNSTNKSKQPTQTVRQRKRKAAISNDNSIENIETSHVCPFCGNNYAERTKLSVHMKIHTKEKPHQCEICFKRFGQTPQLARHMNSHTGSRPFNCKYCTASFADPSTKIKHERIHTNERPYKCTICDKAFSYSNVLKVHLMTHTGEKPYTCKYCGKQFTQAHHKNQHQRLHENLKIKKYDDEGCQEIRNHNGFNIYP